MNTVGGAMAGIRLVLGTGSGSMPVLRGGNGLH